MVNSDFYIAPQLIIGTGAGTVASATDARFPTADEKAALAGSSGSPSVSNKYVTNADSRNTNARTPTAHASSHGSAGADAVTITISQISDAGDSVGLDVGATTGTVCAGDDSRLTNSRQCNNSFDNATTSRTNLSVYSKLESDYSIASKPSTAGCSFTASATGSNIVISDSDSLDPGTDNFSIGPIKVYTVHDGYYDLINKLSGNDGWKLSYATNTGILSLVVGTGSTTLTATCPTALPTYSSSTTQISEIIVTVTRGATTSSVQFYCNGVAVGDTQTIALTATTSVSSSASMTVFDRMAWAIFAPFSPFWNYSLSATIVSKIFNLGLVNYLTSEYKLKWGSATNTTSTENSTFVGGTTGNWAVVDSTIAAVANELEWTLPASSVVTSYLQCNQTPSQFSNGYYNVRFNYKLSSGDALQLAVSRAGVESIGTITPTGDWQTFTTQFYTSGGGAIKIATGLAEANGSVYLFDDFVTTYAGCCAAYDGNPEGYQWHDKSTNANHAILGVNASPAISNRTGVLRYSSATSGTEFILGSDRVCLPVNHVINKIYAYVASGTPTIDIGTAASAADIAASQTLATGWNDIELSNLQSSTYKLNATSNTANAIVWNVFYSILIP